MNPEQDPRFFALLVHRGLISAELAQAALGSADPAGYLIRGGHVTDDSWREWVDTQAGERPSLKRYELGDLIGEGGTARVFEAVDRVEGGTVALKILRTKFCSDPVATGAFVRESKLLMELQHGHIVKGVRVAREGSSIYCAMELVRGDCLQDRLNGGERVEEELALRIVTQVAEALSYLNTHGLVHRDVKPGNIILDGEGRAVLLDLGFAVKTDSGVSAESETTAGTAHYISPEQARGQQDIDVRADIYSLGATLYHLITGSLPFAGGSSEEVMAKQVLEALSGREIRALGLSPQTHYFIEKMMAKDKENRFQDSEDLRSEVSAYLESKEEERRAEDQAATRKKARRGRRLM